jgi:hypothetical protein
MRRRCVANTRDDSVTIASMRTRIAASKGRSSISSGSGRVMTVACTPSLARPPGAVCVQGRTPIEKVARRLMARHGAVFSLQAGHPPPRDEITMWFASAPFDTR